MKGSILKLLGDRELSNQVLTKLSNQLSSIDESYMLSQPQLLLIDAMSSYRQEKWLQTKNKLQKYINHGIENDDMSSIVLLADVLVKLGQSEQALELLSKYEFHIIKNKNDALILAGLYIQFDQDFKADYVLNILRTQHANDEDILILSAKVLSKRGQNKEAIKLLESANINGGVHYTHTLAVIALRLGDLDKSLTYVKSLISTSPEVIEYQLLYVEVLIQRRQFDEAEKVIVDLYQKQPDNTQIQFSYAMLQFNLENIAVAKKMFTDLVTANPEDGESWFILAQIAYDLGNVDETISILERQTKIDSHKSKALYKLAEIHFAQMAYDESLVAVNVLLRTNRLDAKALAIKAKNLIALQQIKEAKRQLDILFGLWSENARNLLKLSRLQLKVNDYIAAEKSLNIAYNLQPNALPVVIDLIKLNIRLNKLIEATNVLVKAEQVGYLKNNYLIILKGDIELAKNNFNAAFNYYLTVLKNDDSNVVALIKLSKISQTKALSDNFIQQLTYLVDKYPDRAIQRHTFADHLFERNKLEQAKFQYQSLIVQDIPSSKRAWALNNLAIIYQREGTYQEAVDVAQQAFSMLPAPAIIDTLGWSLTLLGDVEKGLAYLRQAFSMYSTSPEIKYHIAYALVELNRKEEAKSLLTQIIKLPDTFAEFKLAEQLLSTL
jgi:tetratricopeptide (TPR) repeat protein